MKRVVVDYENGTKYCPGCGIVKSLSCFGRHKRDGFRSRCKACVRLKIKAGEWSVGNKKEAAKRSYKKHAKRIIEKALEWKKNNKRRYDDTRSSISKRLTDGYVRNRLAERSFLTAAKIPQYLVDLERERLRILRALKEIKNEER